MLDKSYRNALRLLGWAILFVALVWFFQSVLWVVQLFVISLLLVYFLLPAVEILKARFRFPHPLAVGTVFAVFLGLIASFFAVIAPVIQQEIQVIVSDMPRYLKQLRELVQEAAGQLEFFGISQEYVEEFLAFPADFQPLLDRVVVLGRVLGESIIDVFFILFIVFYLLYDFQSIRKDYLDYLPSHLRGKAEDIMQIVDTNFGGYIRGTIIRCTIVGLIVGLSLSIIGMPNALLLGVFAGILDVVLYIGPYIAAFPALLIALSPQTPSIVVVAGIYVFVQILESLVLSPVLLGRTVKLKPITVILCLLMGQQVAGFLGMLIAVPLAGITKGLLHYFRHEELPEEQLREGTSPLLKRFGPS